MESNTLSVFLPNWVFLPCDHGPDFDISLISENLIFLDTTAAACSFFLSQINIVIINIQPVALVAQRGNLVTF